MCKLGIIVSIGSAGLVRVFLGNSHFSFETSNFSGLMMKVVANYHVKFAIFVGRRLFWRWPPAATCWAATFLQFFAPSKCDKLLSSGKSANTSFHHHSVTAKSKNALDSPIFSSLSDRGSGRGNHRHSNIFPCRTEKTAYMYIYITPSSFIKHKFQVDIFVSWIVNKVSKFSTIQSSTQFACFLAVLPHIIHVLSASTKALLAPRAAIWS